MNRPPHSFGLHRVLEPAGALPQAAWKLDNSPKAFDNEIAVRATALSVDSSSFRQLAEVEAAGGASIAEQILAIVGERGKLHNPVTGSGGMFVGEVTEVGPKHPAAGELQIGDRIASMVSLTLTPLKLDRIIAVHTGSDRVDVEGTGILFARTLFAKLPEDFSEAVALAVFDVAGAPACVAARAREGGTVLIVGTGKAGLLCLAAARESVGPRGRVLAIEPFEAAAERADRLGFADRVLRLDARDPVAMYEAIEMATEGRLADLVVNVVNAPGTEAASVLGARDDGTVLYFGMATSFAAAALGAEGLAKSTTLLIGNGFIPGHTDYALGLLRRHALLREVFEELCASNPTPGPSPHAGKGGWRPG